MAASNQASSPSSQPVASSSSHEDVKSFVETATAGVAAVAATMATNHESSSLLPIPTYLDIQNSADYLTAKELLNQGNFEPALETIAAAIASTLELLQAHANTKDDEAPAAAAAKAKQDDGEDEEDDEDYRIRLHESLAPLHYLYGTTLLYSIEESAEDTQGMTVGDSHDMTAASFPVEGEEENPDDEKEPAQEDADDQKEPKTSDEPQETNNDDEPNDSDDAGDPANNIAMDVAEDLQIAWENLETARHILVRLLDDAAAAAAASDTKQKSTGDATLSLQLDLAQIHLRLGDLQRINGRYAEAIQDYETALNLRRSQHTGGTTTTTTSMEEDRKLADLHYNLALTYMTASADPNPPEDQPPLEEDQKREYRSKAMQHYVSCGNAFAGHAALLCGASVEDVVKDSPEDNAAAAAPTGGPKTVGLDESTVDQAVASRTLATLRTRVEALTLPSNEKDANKVQEIMDLLREIQEAIDTAEEGEQGVQMVTEMKAQIQEAAEREATSEIGTSSSTTTIGFGTAGAASSAGVAASEPTVMMVVKKKRKATDRKDDDKISKLAKSE